MPVFAVAAAVAAGHNASELLAVLVAAQPVVTATAALVVARDEHIGRQIRRVDAESADIQQIQNALERATSPAERFRVLNNLRHVTDDERAYDGESSEYVQEVLAEEVE